MTTFYIIKPDGMEHREYIRFKIMGEGLSIPRFKIGILTKKAVEALYPHTKPEKLGAIIAFMTSAPVEMGMVKGPKALFRLRTLIGDSPDPKRCAPYSLRAQLGKGPRIINGVPIFLNALHRSYTWHEVKSDREIYHSLVPTRKLLKAAS